MYRKAIDEMTRAGFTCQSLGPQIGMSPGILKSKLYGVYDFSFSEAVKFKRVIKSTLPLEELFEEAS